MIKNAYFLVLEVGTAALPKNRHFSPKFEIFRPFENIFKDNDLIFFKILRMCLHGKLKKRRKSDQVKRKVAKKFKNFCNKNLQVSNAKTKEIFLKKNWLVSND